MVIANKIRVYALLATHSYPKRRVETNALRFKLFKNTRKVDLELKLLKKYIKIDDMTTTRFVTHCNETDKEIVMAIRGTDLSLPEENDIYTDALLFFGKEKCRNCFSDGYDNLRKIYKRYPKYKTIIVGHSLGGRIAIDLLDSDLGEKVHEVHTFNGATAPSHLYKSAKCFMDTISNSDKSFCKKRDKLHVHIINEDPISILSLADKSKTRKVYPRKYTTSRMLKGKNKEIRKNHSILNFI